MQIVSDTHTQGVRGEKPHVIVYIPPGTPFECPDEIALTKIAEGRARAVTAVDIARTQHVADPVGGESDPESTEGTSDERFDELVGACLELDSADTSLFLADGRPKVEALAKVLGGAVTAEERDLAWASIQAD